jgi:hypothetical protein
MVNDDGVADPSDDEGFQIDNRAPKITRALRPRTATPLVRNPRSEDQSLTHPVHTPEMEDRPPKRPRKNPGQILEPHHETGNEYADSAALASLRAKTAARLAPRKAPKGRIPWSDEEVQALLALVSEHGVSYAHLKALDNQGEKILVNRDAEAMRHKLRLLKSDYLM